MYERPTCYVLAPVSRLHANVSVVLEEFSSPSWTEKRGLDTVPTQKYLPAVDFRAKFAVFASCNLNGLGVNSIVFWYACIWSIKSIDSIY